MRTFDPYDLWSTPLAVNIRRLYYEGKLLGKLYAVLLSIADWLAPSLLRNYLRMEPKPYAILTAHECLRSKIVCDKMFFSGYLEELRCVAVDPSDIDHLAWGLGFPWMSKNGLYGPEIPFITHTPYAMEALLEISTGLKAHEHAVAMNMFHGTWFFLKTLKVMHEDKNCIAFSYAPIVEPHIIINANSYAALAYALHAIHGKDDIRQFARSLAIRVLRWVVSQQNPDGSWFYTADRGPWDMIDGFHSCFVVKNLLKVRQLLPETTHLVDDAISHGWLFIRNSIFDSHEGLCRRYVIRPRRDPFKWELYDQAEYLGLLVDFGLLEEAQVFARVVEQRFRKGEYWYCRIDFLGRRWGRDFMRWGIAPFQYHKARLLQALEARKSICAV